MADDERLREALLELQLLREREARTLAESRALLDCLEAYSAAPDPEAALASVFRSLVHTIGAALSMIVSLEQDGSATITAGSRPDLVTRRITAPFDLGGRERNLLDLAAPGPWDVPFDLAPYRGLIVCPTETGDPRMALLVFGGAERTGFGPQDMHLVSRLAGLAGQAVRNARVAAEKSLLAAAIAGSSSGFAISDATREDTPLVYVNRAFEQMTGFSAADVLGQNCRFLSAEPEGSRERSRLRETVLSRSRGQFLLRNKRKSGELFWNDLVLFPVHDADGTVRTIVATQTDVTERVMAEADRDQSRARMERALAATEDAFLVLEADGAVAFANAAVRILFPAPGPDWQPGTAFRDNWTAYLAESADMPGRITRLLRDADLKTLARLPRGREIDLPDGRHVLIRGGPLDDGGLVISGTDVTAMKSAERLLAQRLAAIEASIDGIAVTDANGRLLYQNSAAARMLGFRSPTQGLGQTWIQRFDDAGGLPNGAFRRTLSRETHGRTSTFEVSGAPLVAGGAVITLRDVSEKLETEARETAMMQSLMQFQKQEAIAQLTAGIAHDFNNLLSAINGSASLIDMAGDLPDHVRPHVARIAAAGTQAAKLANRLLDLGTQPLSKGSFDLRSALAELPALVLPSLPDRVHCRISGAPQGLTLRGDPTALDQMLVNLVLNARDAIGDADGQIELTVARVTGADIPPPRAGVVARAADYARIAVHDTGSGMDEATLAEALTPYFTTKGRTGSGLGLATVWQQLQAVGGALDLRSTPGCGTTVTLYWPVLGDPGAASAHRPGTGKDLAGMTILLVDDDAEVGEVLGRNLEARGAEVAVCQDPRDALEAITEDPTAWSALVTDYDMPHMSGGELTRQVRAVAPDLPIMLVTALARRMSDPRVVNGQVRAILAKPVDLDRLCAELAGSSHETDKGPDHAATAG